ncbi:MAG: NAD(P)H-quinone oxidoreductase [Actinomycetales bacterium]|nr:NAD(P)H-quinone oxidoreductase [Actinomycetales bacterium]
MFAVVASHPGGPEVLEIHDIDAPTPGPGQVLIRVVAAGVNRADIYQRQGGHPPAAGVSDTLGLEVSGEIAALGAGVTSVAIGDSVCALLGGGGYAEYAVAESSHVLPVPRRVSVVDAGGIVEVAATVWSNIFRANMPPAGSWILFHGGTSGIGTFGTQLATALGYKVVTTCGTDEKVAASIALGADLSINYNSEDFAERLKQDGIKVSRVLDHVGGPYIARDIAVLALDGHIASIANMSGKEAVINLGALMQVRGSLSSASLRARSLEDKADILQDLREFVWPLFENGTLKPLTHSTFPFRDASEAHRLMQASTHIGKILLVTT